MDHSAERNSTGDFMESPMGKPWNFFQLGDPHSDVKKVIDVIFITLTLMVIVQ